MTVAAGDVLEVSARMELQGSDDVINVFQMKSIGEVSITDQEAIDDVIAFLEAVYVIWKTIQSTLLAFRDVRIRNKTQSTVLGTHPWDTLVNGEEVDALLAQGVAGLINFSTTTINVTLRKYVGGFTEQAMDSLATLTAAAVTTLTNGALVLITDYIVGTGDWQYGHQHPITTAWITPFEGVVSDIPGYQRRRKQGRGS